MPTEIVAPEAPRGTGAYSQGVRAGDFVFISGQGPLDSPTLEVRGVTIEEQTELTLHNVEAVARAAGGSLRDAVKVSVFLASIEDFAAFNETYARVLDFSPRPARTTVACELKDIMVEIDAVLYLPQT
ncbi:MAG TPA: Rid family detoxifying hydrolase [Actinomycetota bacterium]|jgi:2-iminobutanoate/2-iminopropanoate deaminase|nr:Rid family detoxifying hydrolase [Actinomycetota bacterium]